MLPGGPVHDSESPLITEQHIGAPLHQVMDLGIVTEDGGEKQRGPAVLHPPALRGIYVDFHFLPLELISTYLVLTSAPAAIRASITPSWVLVTL